MTPPAAADDAYARKKLREAARHRAKSAQAREIGPIPPVADPERRARALASFEVFLTTYFKARFPLPFSQDHLDYIADTQRIVERGGLEAVAMPRGTGKTSIAECAVLYAVAKGAHEMVGLLGATEAAAKEMLQSIRTELETNEEFAADFPEICHPIRALEGINQRRLLLDGERVAITFTKTMIILPSLPANPAASAIIRVAGLTGRVRGMKFTRPGGKVVRPKLVIVDDPQTDRSAKSRTQTAKRVELLAGAVLGLAGPGEKMSAIMPCTVIVEGDLADQFLDRQKRPEWHGRRTKLLATLPDALDLWTQYGEIRADGLRAEDGGEAARAFYESHRAAMDAGAKASWPERFNPDESSAIQHGMNLWLDNREAFFAEYQNDPAGAKQAEQDFLTAPEICQQTNNVDRGAVPTECELLTAFCDVQQSSLWWVVAAWDKHFGGAVIDYGVWPQQNREYFTLGDLRHTLATAYPGRGEEAAIYAGLADLTGTLLTRDWPRVGGGTNRLKLCLVDAQYQTDVIYQFCRQSIHSALLLPSHGRGLKAGDRPMDQWKEGPGEKRGQHWFRSRGDRGVPHVTIDVNWWKSFAQRRLALADGSRGKLSLFGDDARAHRMYADHLTAETRTQTTGRGRAVDEWKIKPDRPDNHWLDGTVGAAVAASIEGLALPEWAPATKPRKKVAIPDHARAA